MLVLQTPSDLSQHVGCEIGASDWLQIDQEMIDRFADATGDHQWIHVDAARAAREAPGGTTIAHGYLLLSLLPRLAPEIWRIEKRSRSLNYGVNKVRFTAPVPTGSRVRLRQSVAAAEPIEGGVRLIMASTMDLAGGERPALVAETVSLIYD
ncbi:MAG: MaoC family dehydratase [Alphaproteobacteria bacterium]|nr:MaoC family dehydratase [Alphaproteobacteria bacterium]